MGRKKKHPEHNPEQLMNELLDNLVQVWTGEKEPELKRVSAELEISPAKVRKLLITAGERDHTTYFQSSTADQVKRMKTEGLSVKEIQEITGLGYTSVQGYLPHKHIYNLETISAENERIRAEYPEGTRVILEEMDDVQAPPIGTMGTVIAVDDTASLIVDWDNGSGLNVVYGQDRVNEDSRPEYRY